MSAVFVYAIASGQSDADPAAIVQRAVKPVKTGRQPSITDLEQARGILRRADGTPASPVTKLALRLLALTVLRPGTLIAAPWAELDAVDPELPVWQVGSRCSHFVCQATDRGRGQALLLRRLGMALDFLQACMAGDGRDLLC